jgi:hypothetical protein
LRSGCGLCCGPPVQPACRPYSWASCRPMWSWRWPTGSTVQQRDISARIPLHSLPSRGQQTYVVVDQPELGQVGVCVKVIEAGVVARHHTARAQIIRPSSTVVGSRPHVCREAPMLAWSLALPPSFLSRYSSLPIVLSASSLDSLSVVLKPTRCSRSC